MRTRAAFGRLAQRYASSFAETDPVVVFDGTGAGEALREGVWRSFAGSEFFVRPVLPREIAVLTEAVAPGICSTFGPIDDRRVGFEQAFAGTLQINGSLLRDLEAYGAGGLRAMQAAVRLADGLAVSSQTERRRIVELLNADPHASVLFLSDPGVPAPERIPDGARDAVVIWAPQLGGEAASMFALATSELHLPVVVVAASVPKDATRATWFLPERGAEALGRAKVIVDTASHGSETAHALAALGVPIVCDVESGASETLDRVRVYDRHRFGSIFEAVIAALGDAPPVVDRRGAKQPSAIAGLVDGPRVSVIIPTYDRPAMLAWALESVARQRYKNIETIVAVDGGPRLDAIAERFPGVRFIYMPENDSVASCNTAYAQSTGTYVTFLNDDDLFFPHHVSALVGALERSQGSVAHGDVLTAFLEGDGAQWKLLGFESNMSRAVELRNLLVGNQIGMTSCLFRRDCIEDEQPIDRRIPLYQDYGLWLRLAADYDFVHVDRITSCYTIRNQGTQQQSRMWYDRAVKSYEVLYERYPVDTRPALQSQRRSVMQAVVAGKMGISDARPAVECSPVAWPPFDL